MTTREDVLIVVQGDIKAYLRELKKIPGITDAAIKAGAEAIEKENKKAAKAVEDSWAKAGKAIKADFQSIAAVAPQALATAFVTGAIGVAAYTAELMESRTVTIQFSEATGIALDTLTAVDAAFDRSGRSSDGARDSFADFGEVLFDFQQGGGRAKEALELLNIEGDDIVGTYGGVDGALRQVLKTLPQIEDEVIRNAAAQQLFGDAGLELIGVLGDIPLAEFEELARKTGRAIDEEAVEQTERWNAALSVFSGRARKASTDLVDFISAGSGLENTARGFVAIEASAKAAFDQLASLGDITSALASGDAVAFADAVDAALANVSDSAVEAAASFDEETRKFAELRDEAKITSAELGQLSDRQKAAEKAARDAAKAFEAEAKALRDAAKAALEESKALQKRQDAIDDAIEAQRKFGVELLTDEAAARAAINETRLERLASISEIADVLGDSQELAALRQDTNKAFVRELGELETQIALDARTQAEEDHQDDQDRIAERRDAILSVAGDVLAASIQITDSIADGTALALEGALANEQATLGALERQQTRREEIAERLAETENESLKQQLQRELDRVDAAEAATKERLLIQSRAANRLFVANKAAAIAGAIMQGALAVVTALGQLGPIAGAAAAIPIGITTGIQVGIIAAQSAPSFHAGSGAFTAGPDEFGATLRRGERVVDQRDAENRESSSEEASRGDGGRGSGEIRLFMNTREVGRAMVAERRRGREFTQGTRTNRPGVRPVYITR